MEGFFLVLSFNYGIPGIPIYEANGVTGMPRNFYSLRMSWQARLMCVAEMPNISSSSSGVADLNA